jgi:prepilin-type N-terminal cleavage/methylation domain-containing protein
VFVLKKQKGFSLIELLIVVAIILIIAAIAIPNLLRSRMAANEASAVGSLRTINTSSVTYSSTYPSNGYPATLAALGTVAGGATSASADLLDSVLASGTKSGYTFVYTVVAGALPSTGYQVTAIPVTIGTSGQRGFFTDQSGVIRNNAAGTAASTDAPLQ